MIIERFLSRLKHFKGTAPRKLKTRANDLGAIEQGVGEKAGG